MKKFSFSLENVLNYKNQILDNLQNEHALILEEIRNQEAAIEQLKDQYVACSSKLGDEEKNGITVMQILSYNNYLDVIAFKIKKEQEILAVLNKKEEIKRNQVLESKKDSASIEKLKEKKIAVYNKELQKQDELLIDEFVMNSRSNRQNVVGLGG